MSKRLPLIFAVLNPGLLPLCVGPGAPGLLSNPDTIRRAIERHDIPESDIDKAGADWVLLHNGRVVKVPA